MFVVTNTIEAISEYLRKGLKDLFSEREIKIITQELILNRFNWTKTDLITNKENRLSESDLLFFRSCLKRLQANEPLQYVLGYTFFYDLEIKTDKRALIPRPETEELVDWVVKTYQNDSEIQVLDLCTGSGCIALAIKSQLTQSSVSAIDVSKEALRLANENASNLELEVTFFEQDILESVLNLKESQFDCWVSNPPYIPESDKVEMAENVLSYEPGLALFVENNLPIIFYERIAEHGLKHLKKGGSLFFEIHERFGKEVIDMLQVKGYVNIELRQDLQGKDRMVRAILP
jgi:release factor glutamine methyltransferase